MEDTEKDLLVQVDKEIEKLKYYLEESDEIIEEGDFVEIEVTHNRTTAIHDKLCNLIAHVQELKIERGIETARAIRQWKKDTKERFAPWTLQMGKIENAMSQRRKEIQDEIDRKKAHEQSVRDLRRQEELRDREREMWEEKFNAELTMTEKKIELERTAKASLAKLPQLKITPFKGTAADWVRFENMFLTQINSRPISDEEKFGYLLESVGPKVRDRIANLKPGTVGYKTAWERLKKEYGQTKVVVNAHMDEIINLTPVRGSNYSKVQEFYEKLSKNFDALQTLEEGEKLHGFVMATLNKLPQVKPDLVRVDENWEDWSMEDLIDALQKWLRRNNTETSTEQHKKPEKHLFTLKGEKPTPYCLFCRKQDHWSDSCTVVTELVDRRKFFMDHSLCFNCGRSGHRAEQCRRRGCLKCKYKHHTSICDKRERASSMQNEVSQTSSPTEVSLTGYTTYAEEKVLPAIIPVCVEGEILWAYLDTGSGRNFISREAVKKLKLKPARHESREILTVNGSKVQSMPIFDTSIVSLDGKACEEIELTGSRLADFTTVRRPDMNQLKLKYSHTQDKRFYMTSGGEYQIHLILGDSMYSKIRTEKVFKGNPGEPLVEETTFGWVVHGGDEYTSDGVCMYLREVNDYEKLYSLDVLGVEDRGENDQFDVLRDFKENIARRDDGRYEVSFPWIPGAELSNTNEVLSRKRLQNVERRLSKNENLREEYADIIEEQLRMGIVEEAPQRPTGERVFYMPHKLVIKESAVTTKVRMVFDASAKPYPLANSINDCMFTGPPLQPLLWDIMVRARMSTNLLLGDIEKAFLQIGVKEKDRDAFRFLFNVKGEERHLRFMRVPFGVEASPFVLGATLQNHLQQQGTEFEDTVRALKENTYVDNLMQMGGDQEQLVKFKKESTEILENAKFPVHKWESNVRSLESENMPNPSKILGHTWNKEEDTLKFPAKPFPEDQPVTKRTILSYLGAIYDPLGIVSPTMAQGKHIYRQACDEKKGWNAEVSSQLRDEWFKWTKQLKTVEIPRSVATLIGEITGVHLHLFADASNLACCAAAVAVVEQQGGISKGLLTSKSRISKRNTSIARLELVSGHMAANMAKNLHGALQRWPINSTTIWMDSMVALYWLTNPAKAWKVFVANRVRKIAEATSEIGITWKYVPTDMNLADLGSRGATIAKMERGNWLTGPKWLLDEKQWPQQPKLKCTEVADEECRPTPEGILHTQERKLDEWDALLERGTYWRTMRVTAWMLRFISNCKARGNKLKRRSGPLVTEEITTATTCWVRRVQRAGQASLQSPGWKLVQDEHTGVLKCEGRVKGYRPTYLPGGPLAEKLVAHVHNQIMHLGVANTMASVREGWWIPKLRARVKKTIKRCNVCKVFSTRPYEAAPTSALPEYRTEGSRPFEVTGVDFAGPLSYRVGKEELGKYSIIIFTCASSRAVHLEVTRTQTADEFQKKLNAFISRRTRPRVVISDNAGVFKTTADWIRAIRKSEKLQNYLAREEIRWQFNLTRSPWWGGFYERLIKEIKKTLHKTLGRSRLSYEAMESVVMDIERNLNNRPLTYVEAEGEEEVLTPNVIMWGRDAYPIEYIELIEDDKKKLTKMNKRLEEAKAHAWGRWKREYIHSLMEGHRLNKEGGATPVVGEVVLVVGDEKNRGEWKKGKVSRLIQGKDGVVRGVILLHKGHTIERPLQLVCPLEIRGVDHSVHRQEGRRDEVQPRNQRVRRPAAQQAAERIAVQMRTEEED